VIEANQPDAQTLAEAIATYLKSASVASGAAKAQREGAKPA
jgi:hypothetical protein